MDPQEEAYKSKNKMIIDMAISFSAMNRVFEKGSKPKIAEKIEFSLGLLDETTCKDDFERIHSEFCNWFVENVRKSKRNPGDINDQSASYGQAAKLFNVATKVYLYYCHLPNNESVVKLLPLIHAAVDTLMMKYLKTQYPEEKFQAGTIEAVGRYEYLILQKLVTKNIQDKFMNQILPVQWDDIVWFRLNRPVKQFV